VPTWGRRAAACFDVRVLYQHKMLVPAAFLLLLLLVVVGSKCVVLPAGGAKKNVDSAATSPTPIGVQGGDSEVGRCKLKPVPVGLLCFV